ncbi:MAG: leucyl aminopeptidase [Planctomycetia bacterium]
MEIRIDTRPARKAGAEALVLLCAKGDPIARAAGALGTAYAAPVAALVARKLFEAGAGQARAVVGARGAGVGTLVLVGLGDPSKAGAEGLKRAMAAGLRVAGDHGARRVAVAFAKGLPRGTSAERAGRALGEAACMSLYRWEGYRTQKSKVAVEAVALLVSAREAGAARRGLSEGRALGEAVCFTRDLGNEPPNVATPRWIGDRAQEMARAEGLQCTILEKDEMERLGMGSLLGVARGSAQAPRLVVLTYVPAGRPKAPAVALVGKGITFDTGGISIKPAAKMEDMKFDMCGGGAVLGAMLAIARLKPAVRVSGLVPLVENMPDGNAYKPGDILKAMNGVTIEVKNTDAEGRLILADALAYAAKHLTPRPQALVDIATLTGACVVALGDQYAAVLGHDDVCGRLLAASEASGDPLWRLPLNDGYRSQIESVFADVSNLGGPGGGVQTGAAFLEKFVDGLPWAHLDIAGLAWTERDAGLYRKGATGYGVRLLVEAVRGWARGR